MSKKKKKESKGGPNARKEREDRADENARQRRASSEVDNGQKPNAENRFEGSSQETELSEGREVQISPYTLNETREDKSSLEKEINMHVKFGTIKESEDINRKVMESDISGDRVNNAILSGIEGWKDALGSSSSKER